MGFNFTKRLAPIVVMALVLVACGSGDSALEQVAESASESAEPTPVATTEPVTAPTETPTETPTAAPAEATETAAGSASAANDDESDAESDDDDTAASTTTTVASDSDATGPDSENTTTTTTAPPAVETGSTLAAVNAAQWSSNVSIQVTDTSFVFASNGLPSHELPDQFLIPSDGNMPPFSDDDIDADFNIANTSELIVESPITEEITLTPVYSETITLTGLSTIGVMISGVPLFNDYEDQGREFVALDDNLSLNGVYFIDACNGHPLASGNSYHYHGVPYCITDTVDVAGQHSTVIGFLLDGFPVYGSKDAGGVTITSAELDECSGHFGATPEFPEGIYHYHLTEDRAPYSIDCFHGVIDYTSGGPGGPPGGGGGERPDGPPPGDAEGAGAPPADGTAPEGAAPEGGAPPEDAAAGQGAPPDGAPADGAAPAGGPGGDRPGGGGGQGPDFAAAAAALGVTEDALRNALGGPPPDFDAAAATLGISITELQAALDAAS